MAAAPQILNDTRINEFGLRVNTAFIRDPLFLLALAAGPLTSLGMVWLLPARSLQIGLAAALNMILWQPAIEELLFRGLIQSQLSKAMGAMRRVGGISAANLVTSLLFSFAHLLHHNAWWAVAVIVPSLIFGYFRERHRQVYSAFILHAVYNACYLLAA